MSHLCHAVQCDRPVPPKMLFCLQHWRMVSKPLQRAVWKYYRPGQEIDKRPSARYLFVQRLVVGYVATKEGVWNKEFWKADAEAAVREAVRRGVKLGEIRAILTETSSTGHDYRQK